MITVKEWLLTPDFPFLLYVLHDYKIVNKQRSYLLAWSQLFSLFHHKGLLWDEALHVRPSSWWRRSGWGLAEVHFGGIVWPGVIYWLDEGGITTTGAFPVTAGHPQCPPIGSAACAATLWHKPHQREARLHWWVDHSDNMQGGDVLLSEA